MVTYEEEEAAWKSSFINSLNMQIQHFPSNTDTVLLFCLSVFADQPLCSHMSAPNYFAESISSELGFWGVRCENYFDFLIGKCGESGEDEDNLDDEDLILFRDLKRIDGLPQNESGAMKPVKILWQLMGEHCNER